MGRRAVLLLFVLGACGGAEYEIPPPPYPTPEAIEADLAGLGAAEYIDRAFIYLLARSPERVMSYELRDVVPPDVPRFDDISGPFVEETNRIERIIDDGLERFDPLDLEGDARDDLEAFDFYIDDRVEAQAFSEHVFPVTRFRSSLLGAMEFAMFGFAVASDEDAQDYIRLLLQVRGKLEAIEARLDACAAKGIVTPRHELTSVVDAIGRFVTNAPTQVFYYELLAEQVADHGLELDVLDDAEAIVADEIIPGYRKLNETLSRLTSSAPESFGLMGVSGGETFYEYAVRNHTTTTMTPEEIHTLGESEITRVHAELEEALRALGYATDQPLARTLEALAEDSGFLSGDALIERYRTVIAEANTTLDDEFGVRPLAPLVVVADPGGGGYYIGPLEPGDFGVFYANGTDSAEPIYTIRSLAYHEGVPGHHLQVALNYERDAPLFRRVVTYTAFDEGWALYAERLASELDWYDDDPESNIGRLQWETLRAARLVVDSGIHARGWTRDEAIRYMDDNVAFDPGTVSSAGQADRYAAWPGQATAYQMGMLTILRIRADAEARLGAAFDRTAFHRHLLTGGSLPLPILERRMGDWVDAQN